VGFEIPPTRTGQSGELSVRQVSARPSSGRPAVASEPSVVPAGPWFGSVWGRAEFPNGHRAAMPHSKVTKVANVANRGSSTLRSG
jgi:hypothetical protein